MNAEERNRVLASGEEWDAFAVALGWQMYAFIDGECAWFADSDNGGVPFRLTERQRDDILRAISSAREVE